MTHPNVTGRNALSLRRHFETVDGIPGQDADMIFRDAAAVFARCRVEYEPGTVKGLIYGFIQSGKTAVILALLAIAADNGIRRFVVATSDLNDLYEQTLDRVKRSLNGFAVFGKRELKGNAPGLQHPAPTVIVASKNVRMLPATRIAATTNGWHNESVLIVDDEADQASLDTRVNRPNSNPSGVNRELTALRRAFPSLSYIQTTATPQALLLQDPSAEFRPDFVAVTTPGAAYCGGNTFFINEDFDRPRYLRFVPNVDVVTLRSSAMLPETMKVAIVTFLISAAVLRLRGMDKNYQALIHTSLKKDEHQLVQRLVDDFTRRLAVELLIADRVGWDKADKPIMRLLSDAYKDVQNGVDSTQFPKFSDVVTEAALAIASTQVIEINSRTGEGVQQDPNRRHIIYVGGTKIGRGVTIKNLLVTYYARDAQSPQIDTVLQHARMYGYRIKELPLTRIFLPINLAERFRQIHITDNAMRDVARETGKPIPVIPIPLARLRPTRRNVLRKENVELTTYLGGRQYYPLLPIFTLAELDGQTDRLDKIIDSRYPKTQEVYDVSIDDLLVILEGNFAAKESPGAWDDELIRRAVRLLRDDERFHGRAQIVVGSRTSDVGLSGSRGGQQVGSLLSSAVGDPPFGADPNVTLLVLMKLTGHGTGWSGNPFWVPLIRFPNGNYAFSLNRAP
jgi:Z1 domain